MLDQVDSAIPTCPGSFPQCTELVGNPVVHVVGTDGMVTTSQIDDSTTYPLPAGFAVLNLGLRPTDIARGANGFVAAGKAHIWDSNLFHNVAIRSVLWFSPDGASWQRIDLRDVVGDVNLDVTSVAANGTGFLAAGEIGTTDMRSPSRGIVLASADGVAWHTVAELPGTYSIDVHTLRVEGDVALVTASEYICTADSAAMSDFSLGGQTRVWAAVDAGATFAALDLAAAGVAASFPAPPADPATCPADTDSLEAFRAELSLVDVAGGQVVLGAPDAVTVATTRDLTTWTTAALPNGVPAASADARLPESARLAVSDGDALVITSLEPRRGPDGSVLDYGAQVLAWRSDNAGASWSQLDAARPLLAQDTGRPRHVGNGVVAMTGLTDAGGAPFAFLAPAGELVAWGSCDPKPEADCSFADLTGAQLDGADLHGIDLRTALLTGAVLDGADLTDADLTGAGLTSGTEPSASLRDAQLAGAHLAEVRLMGVDLTGASLAGTDLSGAVINIHQLASADASGAVLADIVVVFDSTPVEGLVLRDTDLTDAYFTAFGDPALLHGADFSGANLTKASFGNVDLTGATFDGANFGNPDDSTAVAFRDEVICPDGAPVDTTQYGAAACRLG